MELFDEPTAPPPHVHILPEEVNLALAPDTSLLALCCNSGIPLAHACGGLGRCSTCRVLVISGAEHCSERTDAESALAVRFGFDTHVRLACQTHVSGPVEARRLVLDEIDASSVSGAAEPGTVAALGEEIVAAILFCDIRGFTRFSQRVMPYDAIHMLNRFYATLGPEIVKHGGEINNTMGDGFLAIFRQEDEREACEAAVRAGMALLDAMQGIHDYAMHAYDEPLRIGVGIHCGPVICGSIGHGPNRRLTVIGDTVNRASRIESATKVLGRPLLFSEQVRENLPSTFPLEPVGDVSLRGIEGDLALWGVARY
jgi:adenylate cyclase